MRLTSRPSALLPLAGLLLALAAVAGGSAASTQRPPPSTHVAPTTIVVRTGGERAMRAVEARALDIGYVVTREVPALHAVAVTAPPGVDAASAVGAFALQPGVVYAEPLYSMARADAPSDALFSKQSYLDIERAPEAWQVETGDPSVIVAVLDTGIDVAHPDLRGRIWSNPDEVAGNGLDDDGDGCIDDVHGCAFVADPQEGCEARAGGDVADDFGHGTFVSGIIAANADGQGMVGVASGVTILPVKVLDCVGGGNSLDLAVGVIWAAQNGARVINISLGGNYGAALLAEALRIAREDYDVVIVAASGNSGGEGVWYPARYDSVIAVGATAADGITRAPFSTAGPEVDVAAIGQGIVGTVPDAACDRLLPCLDGTGDYAVGSGTSFSAPQVAGLAALIRSRRPALTAESVAAAITSMARPVAQDGLNWAGAGRIDMAASLTPPYRLGVPGTARN